MRTLAQLRSHLANGLADLPLEPKDRHDLIRFVNDTGRIVERDKFWTVLDDVHGQPGGPLAHFPAAFASRYGHRPPTTWVGIATRVAALLVAFRGANVSDVSALYREKWNRGDPAGLFSMLGADGVRAGWVQRAISELQERQMVGTPPEKRRATALLRRLGSALAGVDHSEPDRDRQAQPSIEARRATNRAAQQRSRRLRVIRERLAAYTADIAGGVVPEVARARALRGLRPLSRQQLAAKLKTVSKKSLHDG